jgi:hypothetical protein
VCYLAESSYYQSIGQYNISGSTPQVISDINNVTSTITESITATYISNSLYLYCASNDSGAVVQVDYTSSPPDVSYSFIDNLYDLNIVAANNNYLYLINTIDTGDSWNNIVSQYNASTGIEISSNFINLGSKYASALAISNDGNYLYIGIYNTIRVYDANTGYEISGNFINDISNGDVTGIAISNNYLYVLVVLIQTDNGTETTSYAVNKYNVYTQSQTVSASYTLVSSGVDANGNAVTASSSFSATASGDTLESALASLGKHTNKNFIEVKIRDFSCYNKNTTHSIEFAIK